jgi:hypothetical protein
MYRTSKEDFGFEVTLNGKIAIDEMKQWRFETIQIMLGANESFSVLFDFRDLRAGELDPEVQKMLSDGWRLFKREGMLRSCVILDNRKSTLQYKRRALTSVDYFYERYIDASTDPEWRKTALAWLEKKIDPGK